MATKLQQFLTSLYNSISIAETDALLHAGDLREHFLNNPDEWPDDTVSIPVFHAKDLNITLEAEFDIRENDEGEADVYVVGPKQGSKEKGDSLSSSMEIDIGLLETFTENIQNSLIFLVGNETTEGGDTFSVSVYAAGEIGNGIRSGRLTFSVEDAPGGTKILDIKKGPQVGEMSHTKKGKTSAVVEIAGVPESNGVELIHTVIEAGRTGEDVTAEASVESTGEWVDRNGSNYDVQDPGSGDIFIKGVDFTEEVILDIQDHETKESSESSVPVLMEKDGVKDGIKSAEFRFEIKDRNGNVADPDIACFVDFRLSTDSGEAEVERLEGGVIMDVTLRNVPPIPPGEPLGTLCVRTRDIEEKKKMQILCGEQKGKAVDRNDDDIIILEIEDSELIIYGVE